MPYKDKLNQKKWYQDNKSKVLLKRKQHYLDNRDSVLMATAAWQRANPALVKSYSIKSFLKNPEKRMCIAAKSRAKKRGLDFNLEPEDIVIPVVCPILKIPLEYTFGKGAGPKGYSPSLDRIDPKKGYVKGNVQVISQRANVMKNDATIEELKEFANWVRLFTRS